MLSRAPRECKRPTADLTGRYIGRGNERLQLLNMLGCGSYGAIYRAKRVFDNGEQSTDFAVKVMLRMDRRNPNRHESQCREMDHHYELATHPNIITLHSASKDKHYVYIVMDYCPGGDLLHAIARDRVFARNDALIKHVFLQIIDAVAACHESSIFHRDLKPENVLVSEDLSQVYLSDFGLSTKYPVSHRFGIGSRLYMSPECVKVPRDRRCYDTRRGDIWALGLILMNMAFGRSPWNIAYIHDPCFRSYMDRPNFLRRMLPISEGAADILKRTLAIDPKESIDLCTLRRMIQDLDSFYMSEEEVTATGGHVKFAWDTYAPKENARARRVSPELRGSPRYSSSNSLLDDSDDSDEREAGINSFTLNRMEEGEPPIVRTMRTGEDLSTDEDSSAPATPETFAEDPDFAVPDDGTDLDFAPATPWRLAGLPEPKSEPVKSRTGTGVKLFRRLMGNLISV